MPKSLHHCCRIYCSLDAEITALVVTENTALLVTVHNYATIDFRSQDFYLKINGKVNYKIFSQKIKTTEPLNLVTKGVKMIGK